MDQLQPQESAVVETINPTPLINRSAVRKEVFRMLESRRPHLAAKLTRVSESFFIEVNAAAQRFISSKVETMGSTGKTVK